MTADLSIRGRTIGRGNPCYIVAEMSANHRQNFDTAARIITAIKNAGADAVKVQTYTPDTLTIDSDAECFRIGGGTLWDGRTLHDLYAEAYMPWEWQSQLKAIADELSLDFFSTPFDFTAVDFLETLDVPAHKIASFEIVDIPLIRKIAATAKPLFISTGMATVEEIDEALSAARSAGADQIALLKCTSAYPARPEDANLRTLPDMAARFGARVGLSDHTLGIAIPVAAVTLGACVVEKHFTLSRATPGPDSAFSLEPDEFRAMVDAIRTAEKALGHVEYGLTEAETRSRPFRRSLFVVQDMKAGQQFSASNVRSIRPAHGLHPRYYDHVLRCHAACDLQRSTPLRWEHLAQP
jgi:N-acetylneuraminate synthase